MGVVFLRYGDVFGAGGRARWAGVKKRRRAPNAPFLNETSKQKQPSLSFYTQDLLLDATVFLIDLVQEKRAELSGFPNGPLFGAQWNKNVLYRMNSLLIRRYRYNRVRDGIYRNEAVNDTAHSASAELGHDVDISRQK